jgi:deazaflavin-dependent oxidoreductase (nitroreductase family)
MSTTPTTFEAGRPRISGPIRRISRPLAPLARPLAGRRLLPLYAVLHHEGRTSGKAYATPVVALRTPDGFIIPLPFGDATQWARNLFAAGGASVTYAGQVYQVAEPRVIERDDPQAMLPRLIRFLAARVGIRQFVRVRRVGA